MADLHEIYSPTDEGWFDISLKITSIETDTHGMSVVMAYGLYNSQVVGVEVDFRNDMIPGLVDGHFDRDAFMQEGIVFCSLGKESDLFLAALAQLYKVDTHACHFARRASTTAIPLEEKPINIQATDLKFKVFFNTDSASKYAELFVNVDVPNRVLELAEKDEEYRRNIIVGLGEYPDK